MSERKIKSLYIHIPFCEHICDYCDFTKVQYFSLFARSYINELQKELDSYSVPKDLETIYIGGGTPTCLEDDLFLRLLKMLSEYTKGVKEFTIEANPESLSLKKLKLMKEYGVNRISIGVETTNNEILKNINRHHTFEDVKIAVRNAQEIGFDNLNVDLILGLPGASLEQIKDDLTKLVSLNVQHISCYSLTVHPNTVFYLKGVQEPLGDEARVYYDYVNNFLKEQGFIHYEVSNWAKPSYESKHNYTYWKNEHYYGLGLGASGYIKDIRYTNTKSINEYLKGRYLDYQEKVNKKDDAEYQIMLNLRTIEGIDLNEFETKFGFDLYKTKRKEIEELVKNNFLILDKKKLIPTYEGMMTLDQIILKLI